jgi:trans-aconitate 2-methyltransferase
MPWNPDQYEKFIDLRNQPFYDLMAMIKNTAHATAVDVGCGTGTQTAILAQKFANTNFLGIDASTEMLAKARENAVKNLRFEQGTIEAFAAADEKYDLIFSNAALQWADDHHELFPQLLAKLNSGGEFAVQMPVQPSNVLNIILLNLASSEPFATYLNGFRRTSPVLSMDDYAQIMFESGLTHITVVQKVYPIIADNHEKFFEFISGSTLIPYQEKMNAVQFDELKEAFLAQIRITFPKLPALYAFKRLLLYGSKP